MGTLRAQRIAPIEHKKGDAERARLARAALLRCLLADDRADAIAEAWETETTELLAIEAAAGNQIDLERAVARGDAAEGLRILSTAQRVDHHARARLGMTVGTLESVGLSIAHEFNLSWPWLSYWFTHHLTRAAAHGWFPTYRTVAVDPPTLFDEQAAESALNEDDPLRTLIHAMADHLSPAPLQDSRFRPENIERNVQWWYDVRVRRPARSIRALATTYMNAPHAGSDGRSVVQAGIREADRLLSL